MRYYDCCEHCKHDINDPPHDRPCIMEGCEEAREREAREFQRCMENAQDLPSLLLPAHNCRFEYCTAPRGECEHPE